MQSTGNGLRKYKIHVFLIVVLVVVTTIGFYFSLRTFPNISANVPNTQQYEASISKGLDYLESTANNISPLQWLMIDYLQRKFSLEQQYSAVQREIKPPSNEPDATDFKVYRRIIEPDSLIKSLPTTDVSPMRQMLMSAAHCDHIPMPSNFYELLKNNINAGGYNLTHVAFALGLMKDNSCPLSPENDLIIREATIQGLVQLADKTDVSEDLRYEAVAFLLHLGRRDLVQPRWLNKITEAQQPDGGWSILAQDKTSSDHATVVALWALLEYSRPETPESPIIRTNTINKP
jgi:hypothetical protein